MKKLINLTLLIFCTTIYCQEFNISKNITTGKFFKFDKEKNIYETLNWKAYKKIDTLILLEEKKYSDLFEAIILIDVSKDEIKKHKESLNIINNQIKRLKKDRAFYRNEYVKEYMEYTYKKPLLFWNERSKSFYDLMSNEKEKNNEEKNSWSLLNSTGFNFGGSTSSVYTELANGQLYIFKISLGAMIAKSANKDTLVAKKDEAYQRLISSGGNTVLKIEYPLFYWHGRNNQWTIISRFIFKGTADFPEFGTETDDWAGSTSYGIDFYADIGTDNNKLRFFMNANTNKIKGTDSFISNLGIQNNSFSFGQLKLGLIFNQNISLSFLISTFGTENSLNNRNIIIGGRVLH